MRRAYALSEEEFCRAEAELELAVSLGLIGQAGLMRWNSGACRKTKKTAEKKLPEKFFTDPAALPDRCTCNMS